MTPAGRRAVVSFAVLTGACSAGPREREPSLVVDRVRAGYAADRAGLAEGDRLALESLPRFEALALRAMTGQSVELRRLSPRPGTLRAPPGLLGLELRPELAETEAALHERARAHAFEGRFAEAVPLWRRLASRAALRGDRVAQAYFGLREAGALLQASERARAIEAAARSIELARGGGPGLHQWACAEWVTALAAVFADAEALEALEALEPLVDPADPLQRARLLHRRAVSSFRIGRADEAAALAREALSLLEVAAPGGALASDTLLLLARNARGLDRFEEAVAFAERARTAARRPQVDALSEAAALGELAVIANRRGKPDEDLRWSLAALELYEGLGVRNANAASIQMRLGNVSMRRGDVAEAEARYRTALDAFESEAKVSLFVGWALANLSAVQQLRGDLDGALDHARRSVQVRRATSHGGPDLSVSLRQLGSVLVEAGQPVEAEAAYREALAITGSARTPFTAARAATSLAGVLVRLGKLDEARDLVTQALRRHAGQAPGGPHHADALSTLGDVELNAGRLREAERAHRQALAIRRRVGAGSVEEAASHYALGRIARLDGRLEDALASFADAVASLETQLGRIGGMLEDRARFGDTWAHVHRDLIDGLLRLGRVEEAFLALERYRVGSFGALLGQRDLAAGASLPEALHRERRRLALAYEQAVETLSALAADAPRDVVEARLARVRALRAERGQWLESVRLIHPELAALEDPAPPALDEAARRMGRGTLLLSYLVLSDRVVLLTLRGGEPFAAPRAYSLPIDEAELHRRIEVVGDLVRSPHAPAAGERALAIQLGELYDRLLGPARGELARSRHLVILPDGPLHLLPFGALTAEQPSGRAYLVETHSLTRAASLTLLLARSSVRGSRPAGEGLVAFGDPRPPQGLARAAPSLPGAREEVRRLGSLFEGGARVFVGAEADERRVKSLAGQARYLHFACHARADDRFPLDSYLALAESRPDAAENGRLHAWEIYEELRLDAEVVTLSACDSGVGPELAGAGLLGLTYAFQFAGARSVVASLWPVADRPTAALMGSFYTELRRGGDPAEALRRARVGMLRTPAAAPFGGWPGLFARPALSWAHPYYWAAFELFGMPVAPE
jgi:CHAT domain-containing protein/Tfp pilus assembly protein PilF